MPCQSFIPPCPPSVSIPLFIMRSTCEHHLEYSGKENILRPKCTSIENVQLNFQINHSDFVNHCLKTGTA